MGLHDGRSACAYSVRLQNDYGKLGRWAMGKKDIVMEVELAPGNQQTLSSTDDLPDPSNSSALPAC
jgi:hypothetical protein